MDGGDESRRSLLLDRVQNLKASHQKLKQQFQFLLQEKTIRKTVSNNRTFQEKEEMASDSERLTSLPGWGCLPGDYFFGSPYRSVLGYMGHAVHVSKTGSGEIIYWNCAAEKLYGYKDYEAVGQSVVQLLFDEEHHPSVRAIMERLTTGDSWSGQLPLKKRSGQNFMAMVSKSPLYEDGKLVGIVTVSSDAALFNITISGNMRTHQSNADEQSKFRRINLKEIWWHPQPQVVAVPELPSSISNIESQDAKANKPPRVPALKLFSKLQRGAISNLEKVMDENIQQNDSEDNDTRNASADETCFHKDTTESTSHIYNHDSSNHTENALIRSSDAVERKHADMHMNPSVATESPSGGAFSGSYQGFDDQLPRSDGREFMVNEPNITSVDSEDASPRLSDSHKIPSSGDSFGSGTRSSSNKGDSESLVVVDSEIHREDLQLREEIGQGSSVVVYRGVWNDSDVAVKVYCGSQYTEETLLDQKKEIDIMRRLRHPNVLLFMGAVEKLAMVTEYLTRGSLFKTLHRRNHSLDIRRRMRMAIDVARGMNYLHHRNPPIVHRDLKSSNLLVDKSWSVKVGDFGLSKVNNATFLTAKSGRGTPQWMAPEVLRNEPSTEKSDVFSFGVILWELMTERVPWSDLNSLQVAGVVGFMDRRLDLPENMDPQVSSIISDCWRSNPEDRPSFEDIIHKMTDLVHKTASMT